MQGVIISLEWPVALGELMISMEIIPELKHGDAIRVREAPGIAVHEGSVP
jgi:archaeosine-15-forming tRNA-guanine transglycosylase